MLYAGLDLSRQRLDVHVLDEGGRTVEVTSATREVFGLRELVARISRHGQEVSATIIDVGVEVLNPVQVSAAGMDSGGLKRDFGRDLVFWGGGVDTQRVLSNETVEQVREDVSRHVNDLKPGGGFVFAAVHEIQANVPPENIVASWAAWREHARYRGESERGETSRR